MLYVNNYRETVRASLIFHLSAVTMRQFHESALLLKFNIRIPNHQINKITYIGYHANNTYTE